MKGKKGEEVSKKKNQGRVGREGDGTRTQIGEHHQSQKGKEDIRTYK